MEKRLQREDDLENKNLITPKELAEILKVPISWVYQHTHLGPKAIPYMKIGKYLRFNLNEVLEFFRNKNQI